MSCSCSKKASVTPSSVQSLPVIIHDHLALDSYCVHHCMCENVVSLSIQKGNIITKPIWLVDIFHEFFLQLILKWGYVQCDILYWINIYKTWSTSNICKSFTRGILILSFNRTKMNVTIHKHMNSCATLHYFRFGNFFFKLSFEVM